MRDTSTTITERVTVQNLMAVLEPFKPVVEGEKLKFGSSPPDDLKPLIRLLQTGIRATITGKPWWATTIVPAKTGARFSKPNVVPLSTDEPIPKATTLLCADGDQRWDRVRPDAVIDHKEVFQK